MSTDKIKQKPKLETVFGVIINEQTNGILLFCDTKDKKSWIKIVEARIKKGETPQLAIIRKIKKQTGIQLDDSQIHHLFQSLPNKEGSHYSLFACLTMVPDGLHEKLVKDGKCLLKVMEVKVEQIPDLPMLHRHRIMLNLAIKNIRPKTKL